MKTTEMNPKDFDYVGMKGKYNSEDHSFSLSQPGMIEKITKGVTGVADLPCDSKLDADADTTKLEDVTGFRSKLMEINYLAKTRPDLKVALGFLVTRMQDPARGDNAELEQLTQYINGTKDLVMRIKPMDEIQVHASVDASFGTFKDGKSNTGLTITLGPPNAPILARTTKQKTVSNSSTSAELVAFGSALEEVLWIVELLNELGIKQKSVEIEQDNQSTMRLIEKGPSSTGRTKWLNIKHFWVSEHLQNGDIKLRYVPSLELLADGLTKPLEKKAFLQWRSRILNNGRIPGEIAMDERLQ